MKINRQQLVVSLCLLITGIMGFDAKAFDGASYVASSKLSAGKWVKIRVKDNGIYAISYDDLKNWGFSTPSNVKIYGYGGAMQDEVLSKVDKDDITQIPTFKENNKIYFYGAGGRDVSILNQSSAFPRYNSTINAYSEYGYYFLSENSESNLNIETIASSLQGDNEVNNSLDYAYHEKEESSLGSTGKQFLGEDFTNARAISIPMNFNGIVAKEPIVVQVGIGMSADQKGTISTTINGENVPYSTGSNSLMADNDVYLYYSYNSPYVSYTPAVDLNGTANVNVSVASAGNISTLKLDYIMITYCHENKLGDSSQLRMGLKNLTTNDKVIVSGQSSNIHLWNIDNPQIPKEYSLDYESLGENSVQGSCRPNLQSVWGQFIAFDTQKEQNTVEYVGDVENQDLHAMAVPDMVILTTKDFMGEAQKIASLHKSIDGLDVQVIEHTKIFNEFSSGTPDANAYRKFNKMLWDKDKSKYKYFLLFGTGTFDNRKLIGKKGDNFLMTYQSTKSNDETESYTTDDFFGFLDDNSGMDLASDKLRLGIGRMPVSTLQEAANSVKKLQEYVGNTDYSGWRKNMLIIADKGDNNLHTYQAEGVNCLVSDTLGIKMHINKVYADMYPLNSAGIAETGRNKIKEFLRDGQLVVNYIGHGGPDNLTKSIQMWRKEDAKTENYKNIPLFSFATCDVARFDSDTRGIAEEMFHNLNGGVIACMASSRTVYAVENDKLNRAFLNNLFSLNANGVEQTVGEAFMNAKANFITRSQNKLNFLLLGDPAMRINYPQSKLKITSVNGEAPESATINPLTQVVIRGEIKQDDGSVNTNFNGSLSATLYDVEKPYKTLSISSTAPSYVSVLKNDVLNIANGEVKNGIFEAKMTIPSTCIAQNQKVTLNVVAVDDNSKALQCDEISTITLAAFDASKAISDTEPPIIDKLYIGSESFRDGDDVYGDSLNVCGSFSDNTAISVQSLAIGSSISIKVDGKNSYPEAKNTLTINPDGKSGTIKFLLKNLSYGKHNLELFVSDIANNRSSQTISFNYQPDKSDVELVVAEDALRTEATFSLESKISTLPNSAKIYVVNSKGETVWNKSVSSFPYVWNLNDNLGNRIKEGRYDCYAIINEASSPASTETKKIVVVKQ